MSEVLIAALLPDLRLPQLAPLVPRHGLFTRADLTMDIFKPQL
jgi:hypothetical protein